MALRIDFILDPSGDRRTVGFVSANDTDEDRLIALFDRIGATGELLGATTQGETDGGLLSAADAAATHAELTSWTIDTAPETHWMTVILSAVDQSRSSGLDLICDTRFDAAGTIDDGAEEWVTGWSS